MRRGSRSRGGGASGGQALACDRRRSGILLAGQSPPGHLRAAIVNASLFLSVDYFNCSVVPGRGRGYEYLYPSSWKRDKVRGIELLAHDPEAKEFNLTITSGPAQFIVLGSPEEAELLKVDSFPDRDSSRRSYTLELRILANNELRHFLFKILKTESKVYTLVLQVPEGQWPGSADCARTLLDGLRATTN
ncbi:hypothetical protein SELMODRAFT_411435 [Selaginella moellendorffii]|uniref:PsbP C-terminal domain-containing protein n=1 Tax=Selaginella moellendorffii TaxID=88036 RepID=D8RHX4_SELML|nr:hypothetical protein SELMODRAFT_411435 [Selaginella moellendorffii]